MSTKLTQDQTHEALLELGIDVAEFAHVQGAPSHQEAVARLTTFKALVKKQYREAVLRLHPDRTEGDPVKQELFCLCTQVYEQIQGLCVQRPARAMPLPIRGGRLKINIKVKRG
jgi:hypothetical protein